MAPSGGNSCHGWVAEWLKAPVLKTGRRASVSGVRIPPHPPAPCKSAQRGTTEQWIKEAKNAIPWTRLSCRKVRNDEVRLRFTLKTLPMSREEAGRRAGVSAYQAYSYCETLGGWIGRTLSAPFEAAGAGLMAAYGRDQEREADRVGQEILARSGYDPAALASVLATLESEALLRDGAERLPSFFDTHPSTGERVASAQRRAISATLCSRASRST